MYLTRMSQIMPYKTGHGLCLVINNVVFARQIGKNESIHGTFRGGAVLDASIISRAMAYLDVEFIFEENKTASGIEERMTWAKNLVDSNKDKYHFLIIIINSHGNEGIIYGTDENPVDVRTKIVDPFHNINCEGLQGRPKIFMINACR